jgi:predicted Rossmann fold flavoprotein
MAYDIAVIGGGPAGMMAAIEAGSKNGRTALIERNNILGKKLLLTGKGRCNLTNNASIETFIEKFGRSGPFYRDAFKALPSGGLMDFFGSRGLKLKTERQGRVFPVTDRSASVLDVLKRSLAANNVDVIYGARVMNIKARGEGLSIDLMSRLPIGAKKAILATGGLSYKKTGSTGDGIAIAGRLGHAIVPPKPGLVPMRARERWVKELMGLSLKNVRLTFIAGRKMLTTPIGECMFTHFGISGPLVLDISARVISAMGKGGRASLFIDLKPGMDADKVRNRLIRDLNEGSNAKLKNILREVLPNAFIPVFTRVSSVDPDKPANQITKEERRSMAGSLKRFPVTITGALPIEEAMVTMGGVSTKEIDPRRMESRIVPGLFFAGEMIDGCAASGGYSLQQAFSTGYLAGRSAAG